VNDPVQQVIKILQFIQFDDINLDRIKCAVQTNCQKANACRKGTKPTNQKSPFGPQEIKIMKENLGDIMKELGYTLPKAEE
jgi:hypothetical protein